MDYGIIHVCLAIDYRHACTSTDIEGTGASNYLNTFVDPASNDGGQKSTKRVY